MFDLALAAFDPFSAALVIGVGAQLFGQHQANRAQRRAEEQNAAYYREQKALAELAMRREADIFKADAEVFAGEQVTLLAKAGVDLSGSALMQFANTKMDMSREYVAILKDGAARTRLAELRAQNAQDTADLLGSSSYNTVQTLGTILNASQSYFAYSGRAKTQETQDLLAVTPSGSYSGPRSSFS